jgi:hypothetical protein
MLRRGRQPEVGTATPERPAPRPAPTGSASVLRLQGAAGNRAVAQLLRSPHGVAAHEFPWHGEVSAKWNAALRRRPVKDAAQPYENIIADVPHGTSVTVSGEENGWLHAEVVVDGKSLTGFISRELVEYKGSSAPPAPSPTADQGPLVIDLGVWTTDGAFVALKRAENRLRAVPDWEPTDDERSDLERAADTLEQTNKYVVDRTTFAVSFAGPSYKSKIKVETIEDFILFVEAVEDEYSQATPEQVVGEVRQIWFSGPNWEALLNSPGINNAGRTVDIEHEPDPIAQRFDIPALKASGHKVATSFGAVDFGHVVAGLDGALNGAALAPADPDSVEGLKYRTLHGADAGDPRDFVTWSGDIGQAYGQYLVTRYVEGHDRTTLGEAVATKASPEQLLGDIHGYIIAEVFRRTPPNVGTGWGLVQQAKVSDILRTLYLVDKSGTPAAASYESLVEQVAGKSASELRDFALQRSLAFARPWYAKVAGESRGYVGTLEHNRSVSKAVVLKELMEEFDAKHAENERSAAAEDKIGALIDRFMAMLPGGST